METITWSSQSEADEEIDEEDESNIYIHGIPIPSQILAEVLVRVDNRRDVGYICPLICRRWYSVLSAPGFWISYMIYRSMDLPPNSLRNEPSLNVKKVSLMQAFGRNLISNPSGDDRYESWEMGENGGDGFGIEKPPVGCVPVENIPVAFVTSYDWCSKFQIIDLWKEGIERSFLDEFCPPITVSEYHTGRFNCPSIYLLEVQLLPDGIMPLPYRPMPGFLVYARYPRLSQQYDTPEHEWIHRDVPQRDETTDTSITRIRMLKEVEWRKIEHTFSNYPRGIRYVLFRHSGKDQQGYWDECYGSKMAKASVIVNYGNGERRCIP
ncbi:F-box associated region family protein [Brugia malayi]|uniref:Bm11070 n=1 Tax=Brugia malayi TaxID=6279 RepID=A0A0K0IQI7_BRUMA|nr:F-box associated region family protein [Brugia malayi]CRZ26102.1 Bm11070 [Brugia malayi]VIO99304.1 F-box associated region family protein [Brugia malayi]